ncbi:MAG: choice-of-anchor J domain-containing protein [Anaerolineales bacterium]|nr:choice-of-anchor J domain-containing protein [Anaerolineales bacterium]
MQRKRLFYLLAIVALLVSSLPAVAVASPSVGAESSAAPNASPLQQGDSPETLLEQAKALDAEQNSASPEAATSFALGGGDYPLFMGVDDTTVPAYLMDVTNSATIQAFLGTEVWGSAYDPGSDTVYFNDGTLLYEWPVGGTVNLIGTIADPAGSAQSMVGLAFYDGQLYGSKNVANEAIWAIDTTTAVATVFIDYVDADLDCGGISADPNDGTFYCTNDDSTPYGAGLMIINPDASVTPVTPYPAGQTDIDGLAVSDDGYAYLVIDEPGNIYVYDLVGGAYVTPLTAPWTSSEVFSAGAWIPPAGQQPPVCWQGEMGIPDNDPVGITTTLTISDTGALADLDVSLVVSHTWVGDLIITLEHVDTGTTATLFDRPGIPPSTFGCSGNDIDNVADDEATLTFENDCASPPNPGQAYIPGEHYQGGDPAGPVLAAFDGEDYSGDWTLNISDNAGGDTGTLYEWCLIPGEGEGEPPNIDVDPLSMDSTQATNTQVQQTLTISNTGGGTLNWVIDEENTMAMPLLTNPDEALAKQLANGGTVGNGAAPRSATAADTGSRDGSAGGPAPIVYNSPADFSEGFDDITLLPGQGWFFQNNSEPLGVTDWFQGNDGVFPSQAGATTAYIAANFNNSGSPGTISNWMLTPEMSMSDGDTLSFWTRTVTGSTFPDRLQVRLSTAGSSTNVGVGANDVGDFTTLLLDINPSLLQGGYPDDWAQYTITLSGLPGGMADGRVAWRYFVTDAGPTGANSNYIGIDTVEYVAGMAEPCTALADIPWLSVSPVQRLQRRWHEHQCDGDLRLDGVGRWRVHRQPVRGQQ